MYSAMTRLSIFAVVSALATLGGVGCDRSCASDLRCPETGGNGGDGGAGGNGMLDMCPKDPADRMPDGECGVWVTASWGNDGNPGTQAEPVATLAQAVALAKAASGRIYACGETFAEIVEVSSGVSLVGGFRCEGEVWMRDQGKPAIIAPASPVLAALTLLAGDQETLLADLHVESPDAIEPGASSIAVLAFSGVRATIRRSHFIAGKGADGADGADGDHNGAPAKAGLKGNDGSNACTADVGQGGLAAKLDCGGIESLGGNGGQGDEGSASDGFAGLQPPDPNPQGYGAGGKGENAGQGCTAGYAGEQGWSGDSGSGAAGVGSLTEKGFVGVPGQDGVAGKPGQGGGGGGGSIGNSACGSLPHGGAGGGSGGSGGCGGKAGKGGQAGGSSMALAFLTSGLTLSDVWLTAGNGGNGGNGGIGQTGGQGGGVGFGGLPFGDASGVKAGCHGAPGGQGGNGGSGGGGLGGHSAPMAQAGSAVAATDGEMKYDFANGGIGGEGGNYKLAGTKGSAGQNTPVVGFPD